VKITYDRFGAIVHFRGYITVAYGGDVVDAILRAYPWLRVRMNNAALGVAARSQLAGNVPQQDTAPATG
jgi:hypothetical protein